MEKAVEALFSGAKMLPLHCARCRGPLFEREGKIFCPVCEERGAKEERVGEPRKGAGPPEGLEGRLWRKLEELGERLERERTHEEVMKILGEMGALLEVLRKLEEVRGGSAGRPPPRP